MNKPVSTCNTNYLYKQHLKPKFKTNVYMTTFFFSLITPEEWTTLSEQPKVSWVLGCDPCGKIRRMSFIGLTISPSLCPTTLLLCSNRSHVNWGGGGWYRPLLSYPCLNSLLSASWWEKIPSVDNHTAHPPFIPSLS